MKKIASDIIILHMCNKNLNHMIYSSRDTEWDRIFLSFWGIFCPITSLMIRKIKIFKKGKNCQEMLSFYTCVP